MNYDNKRNHRVCFTGHRPEKINMSERKVKKLLRPAIEKSIEEGYTTFITGMARGFDLIAASIVLEIKKHNSDIHLICALPIVGFEKMWSPNDQKNYRDILNKADYVKVVSEHYSKSCFQLRNMYMVDHSALVICAYNGSSGGTLNTINYAKRNNVDVINILEKEI